MSAAVGTLLYYDAAKAATENRETEEQRLSLKAFITELVGYSCKISCQPGRDEDENVTDWVEVFVMSESRRRITDYLEIQPTGAVGVIFDLYDDPEKPAVGDLSDRCDAYNERNGLTFAEHEDSEDEEEEETEEGTA